jgi:hypothetical protein
VSFHRKISDEARWKGILIIVYDFRSRLICLRIFGTCLFFGEVLWVYRISSCGYGIPCFLNSIINYFDEIFNIYKRIFNFGYF